MSRKEKILEMLKTDDSDPFLHYGLALEYFREEEADQGIAQLRNVVARFRNYVPAWFQLGQKLAAMGDDAGASSALKEGIIHAEAQNDAHAVGEMREFLQSIQA